MIFSNMKRLLPFFLVALVPFLGHANDLDAMLEQERVTQTGTAITIIFDTSGSMADARKMDQAKTAFATWLKTLPDSHALGLIDFYRSAGRLAIPLGTDQREKLMQHVKAAKPSGKTPICQCLIEAKKDIAKRRAEHSPYERHVVVVFTDGKETVDKRGTSGVVQEIMSLRSAQVEVVGIGFRGEGEFMKGAVTQYFDANNEKELIASLSQVDAEIGDDSDLVISSNDLATIEKIAIPIPPAPIPEKD